VTKDEKSTAIGRIVAATAAHFGTPNLLTKNRSKTNALARHIAMYMCRAYVRPGPSYPELARWFGAGDHTTVMHAVQRIEKLRGKDQAVESAIKEIRILVGRGIISEVERPKADELTPCSQNFPRWCS
jgi:chromosomal replication initiator protein